MENHDHTIDCIFLAAIFAVIANIFHQREIKGVVDFSEAARWFRRILLISCLILSTGALFYMTRTIWVPLVFVVGIGIGVARRYPKQIRSLFEPEISIDGAHSNRRVTTAVSIKAVLVSTLVQAIIWVLFGFLCVGIAALLFEFTNGGPITWPAIKDTVNGTATFDVLSVLYSIIVPILTGYVGAYIAGRNMILHGILSQSLFFVHDLYDLVKPSKPEDYVHFIPPLVFTILTFTGPFFGAIGGYQCILRRKKSKRDPDAA